MVFRESETVELKSVVSEDIKKEIIAFANGKGGRLYIGVEDDGMVKGVDDPDGVSLQISNMVRDAVKPDMTMFLHYETIEADGKKIVAVDIQRGTERPYYIAKKGLRPEGVYVRQGLSSAPATNTAIRRMIKETDGDHFEDVRSLEQELSFQAAEKEFKERNVAFGKVQRKTLGLINPDDLYTNLGLLLSDQCVHSIRAAVFEGTTQNRFKDRKEFTGSLFRQMREVYEYIDFRNQTHSDFERLYRIDRRDYPEIAVREALLNLLVHREYSFGASALVSIYEDRIEFTSIGGLVDGMTVSDVMMGISVCRNPKLANVFYRLELIEAYGTGIRKIMDSYAESAEQPQIEVSDNAFRITIPNRNSPHTEKSVREMPVRFGGEEAKVLARLSEQGRITRKEIEALTGMSQTSAGRLVSKMMERGQIISGGRGKNTYYCLSRHIE